MVGGFLQLEIIPITGVEYQDRPLDRVKVVTLRRLLVPDRIVSLIL